MLETFVIILVVLWLIDLVPANTLGGSLHLLLVTALVVLVFRLISGRKVFMAAKYNGFST